MLIVHMPFRTRSKTSFSKDIAHLRYKQQLTMAVVSMLEMPNAKFVTRFTELLRPAKYEELKEEGYHHKKLTPSAVKDEDVEKCKRALLAVVQQKGSIPQRSLLYWIQHHYFSDLFSKKYVKQLVYAVLKQCNANSR